MIRFVVAPDGTVVPDLAARLPGRGIWLSALGNVVETARIRGGFARAARAPVTVSPDLLSGLQLALARRIGEQLGLARRAGQAVAGFTKAREWIETGRAALIVEAADGSPEERARLLGGWQGPVVTPLDGVALGGVFGRDWAVHVAVAAGRLGTRMREDAERLDGLRQDAGRTGPGAGNAARQGRAGRRQGTGG